MSVNASESPRGGSEPASFSAENLEVSRRMSKSREMFAGELTAVNGWTVGHGALHAENSPQ